MMNSLPAQKEIITETKKSVYYHSGNIDIPLELQPDLQGEIEHTMDHYPKFNVFQFTAFKTHEGFFYLVKLYVSKQRTFLASIQYWLKKNQMGNYHFSATSINIFKLDEPTIKLKEFITSVIDKEMLLHENIKS